MPDLYIHKATTLEPGDEDIVIGRSCLPSSINRRTARRMTHLGTLIARILDPGSLDPGTSLIYGSTYADSPTLEGYVDSFPRPSPLMFQSSIHPSAIQQVFVAGKIPVDEFIPLCGSCNLIASMFNTAFSAKAGHIVLVGAEERGNWMLGLGLASEGSWAWSLELSKDPDCALGKVQKQARGSSPANPPIRHERFFHELSDRRDISIPSPDGGAIQISLTR